VECRAIIHSSNSSRCAQFILQGVNTEIFADGFRDKIFDTEIVAALGCTLSDKDHLVRRNTVEIFTAAIAQGRPTSVFGVFILKYFQRAFGTKYLILRLSPHLEVHCVMRIPTSGIVQ
jgi:metal-dependent HD superfamily phosphatase/phosphodiesterase